MKKITLGLLVLVLFIPAVVLAEQDEDSPGPRCSRVAKSRERPNSEELRGEIISVSKSAVTIASGSEDKPEKIRIRIPERRSQLRVLLAQGLGRKAELQCRKTSQGVLTLIRIEGIEGIEVSEQTGFGPGIRERSRDRAQQLSPEDRETFRARFKDMRERLSEDPELREELRESSREDPDAFRQRIRQMMPELHQRPERRRPQRDEDPGGMSNHRGSRMMGRMGPGQEMGPRGREGRRRFSPEDEELQKLERQTHELAEQCHRADGQEKDELGEKLRETLSQVFEKKDQAQSQEVERLEKQLDKLRSRLENREKNREAIINQRFDKLTGQQDDELAW